ncbi:MULTISPECIES: hypothetical protein [unclassified Luteimonas]
MSQDQDEFIRLRPEVSPGYDIDRTRPLRVQQKQTMYPLLVRASQGYAGELVLGANPAAMKTLPNADGIALGFGMLVSMALVCAGLSVFFLSITLDEWGRYTAGLISSPWFMIIVMSISAAAATAAVGGCIRVFVRKEFARPTVFNRRAGTVTQLQGNKRVEARWSDLHPYIEQIRTVHAAGGSLVENFHLVQPADSGCNARNLIEIKLHVGSSKIAAMYYRFLCDYMEGNWKNLPEIYLLGGIRLPLWREYRQHRLSFWFATNDWADRSQESKVWMWLLVPIWTAGWWPMYIFTFIGGRLGWVPQLSESDLSGTAWEESTDGPVPAEFASKVSTRTLHPQEKRLYIVSFVAGLVLWTWLPYELFFQYMFS